jgi:hypothetical protein
MRKIYAFLAAALMSVSVFAAKDVVPTDAVLADYYNQGQVCMCFFVPADMACFDVVVTGSFNGWSSKLADCVPAEAVEGYDGWYVAAFEPEAEPDAEKGIQAKPIMKDADGKFNWSYQVGAATVIRGGVQVVQGGIAGEIDMINYGADAPNVFTVDAWKENPCTAVYHNYKVTVISDGCDGYVIPFIVGDMNNWAFEQMQMDKAATLANLAPTYYFNFKAAEGTEYQIVTAGMDPQTGLVDTLQKACWCDIAYMQKLVDGMWKRIPGEKGDNQLTHENAEILWDLRADSLRWARCAPAEPDEYVVMRVNLPTLNCPEVVEVIGGFDEWAGTPMERLENGWNFAQFDAKASQFFKFRSGIGETGDDKWKVELEIYDDENDEWAKIGDGQLTFGQIWQEDTYKGVACKSIELDFSDPDKYRWTTGGEEAIENVVLTEKAKKVVVDGVIYIVRDNKMFNLQGAQVR